jgi:cytochrome c553
VFDLRHGFDIVNLPKSVTLFVNLLAALGLFATAAMAQEAGKAPAKADAVKGQAIASQACAACHGADGNSVAPANPKLAGQVPEFLAKQLADFKANKDRKNAVMLGMASGLSADDMRNVAAYYASQPAKAGAAKNKDTLELGQKLWRGGDTTRGLPACAGCHGATGAGLPSQYPRLAGQHAEYIETQLKGFRAGERQNDPQRMMRMVAAKLTDKDISAVADYIAGLK